MRDGPADRRGGATVGIAKQAVGQFRDADRCNGDDADNQ